MGWKHFTCKINKLRLWMKNLIINLSFWLRLIVLSELEISFHEFSSFFSCNWKFEIKSILIFEQCVIHCLKTWLLFFLKNLLHFIFSHFLFNLILIDFDCEFSCLILYHLLMIYRFLISFMGLCTNFTRKKSDFNCLFKRELSSRIYFRSCFTKRYRFSWIIDFIEPID